MELEKENLKIMMTQDLVKINNYILIIILFILYKNKIFIINI